MSFTKGAFVRLESHTPPPVNYIIAIPALRAAVGFLAAFLLCVLYGHANFYRDPGSIFFDPDRAFTRWYSAYRQSQAESFIDSVAEYSWSRKHSNHIPSFQHANDNATMCAVILTVRRDIDKQYLEASLGSVLEGMTVAERADVNLQVFFANTDPSRHSAWYQPWLRPLVDKVYTYADLYSFEGIADVLALESAGIGAVAKAPLDYALALQQCYQSTGARYIAVLEDDIIAAESWFARAMWGVRQVELQMFHEGRLGKWMYMRLFSDEGSTGWRSTRIGGNNELPISLAAAAVAYLLMLALRRRMRAASPSPSGKPPIDKWTMLVICGLAVPSFVVLFFQCGKASVMPTPRGVKEESLGCCDQALVFNRVHVPGLVQHLHQSATVGRHDVLTRDYTRQMGLAQFSLYPAMVQHVGTQCAFQTYAANESSSVWSMAFESLNPRYLRRDHFDFVRRLYGVNAIT